jgi:hypothetical protein
MPRLIEIVLFLAPFVTVAVWRLWFPSPVPPAWLIYSLSAFVALMVAALLWVWAIEARDANQLYLPDELHNGRVIPGRPGAPP